MEKLFGFDFHYRDLYINEGLHAIDIKFLSYLKTANPSSYTDLIEARENPKKLNDLATSSLIIKISPVLEEYLGKLFDISNNLSDLKKYHLEQINIHKTKRLFIQRRALKKYKSADAQKFDSKLVIKSLQQIIGDFSQQKFANLAIESLEVDSQNHNKSEILMQYAAWAIHNKDGQKKHKDDVIFKLPQKTIFDELIKFDIDKFDNYEIKKLPSKQLRGRNAFHLTDPGPDMVKVMDEASYCIYCHDRDKDSCRKGLKDKDAKFKFSAGNIELTGCPLDEHISEMNLVKSQGNNIGALAIAMINNPLLAATGHRICNDCMKACIYQTQEPVDIPAIETDCLDKTLSLPYGFEIYSLLTRWNPLNIDRPYPKKDTGYKILVAGLGPSGFTLAHHLLNDGHDVAAIDGLKIEHLPKEISGVTPSGNIYDFKPIKDTKNDLYEDLDDRLMAGFGGVAEYGITVRWNKNYLKIIRLLLERRRNFRMYGGVRFGSQITKEIAFNELGFDHIALCLGAGSPNIINLKNNLANGVRKASDFLMALQLTGAAKKDSLTNLQIRLPALVIGGGLTAIDTATELLAYYPRQILKFHEKYKILLKTESKKFVTENWDDEEKIIAKEFLAHAKEIIAERELAKKEKRPVKYLSLLRKWGGVKILYRKKTQESPAYRLNHEELHKAFEEGIEFVENITPKEVKLDNFDSAEFLITQNQRKDEIIFPARAILIAAGTKPNNILAKEDRDFKLDGLYFQAVDKNGKRLLVESSAKPKEINIFAQYFSNKKSISFFGDMHKSFAGNVVKAMASSTNGYPYITKSLAKLPKNSTSNEKFFFKLNDELIAKISAVTKLTHNIVEVVVRAPLAAKRFKPGQFYRLQNFATNSKKFQGSVFAMESLAMTGAWVDKEKGLISVIILEMGGSSNFCKYLKKNEEIILMGPTGSPSKIAKGKTILLAGGGLGNAVLFSIGKALRAAGSRVIYFAGYKKANDRYKIQEIEDASDVAIWSCDQKPNFKTNRSQDKIFHGNIVDAMIAYASGKLGTQIINFTDIEEIIAIGSDKMMQAVKHARHNQLLFHLNPNHSAVASINSPMQCMMKEICAQCLQKHIDPKTGKETFVFSCYNQDQNIDTVSFDHLHQRLRQNSLQEKLTAKWIKHVAK
jgi:NADPH-dependent glutamate synthase beta subunit-like oxidoreductase/NAD(P)H-flavin reductase